MDSTPSIGGFMIFLYVIVAGLVGIAIAVYSITLDRNCNHTHFAEYRSRGIKRCVDCGLELRIDAKSSF
jgi:hypothetical protein